MYDGRVAAHRAVVETIEKFVSWTHVVEQELTIGYTEGSGLLKEFSEFLNPGAEGIGPAPDFDSFSLLQGS